MSEAHALVVGNPSAHSIGSTCGHMIARAHEFIPIDWVGRIVISKDAVDAAHNYMRVGARRTATQRESLTVNTRILVKDTTPFSVCKFARINCLDLGLI